MRTGVKETEGTIRQAYFTALKQEAPGGLREVAKILQESSTFMASARPLSCRLVVPPYAPIRPPGILKEKSLLAIAAVRQTSQMFLSTHLQPLSREKVHIFFVFSKARNGANIVFHQPLEA